MYKPAFLAVLVLALSIRAEDVGEGPVAVVDTRK